MNCLLDPRIFNWSIIVMFVAASVRRAFAGNWPQSAYWISAAALNVAVTFMEGK